MSGQPKPGKKPEASFAIPPPPSLGAPAVKRKLELPGTTPKVPAVPRRAEPRPAAPPPIGRPSTSSTPSPPPWTAEPPRAPPPTRAPPPAPDALPHANVVRRIRAHWAGATLEARLGADTLTVTALPEGFAPAPARVRQALASARVAGGMGTEGVPKVLGLVRLDATTVGLATQRIGGEPLAAIIDGRPLPAGRCLAMLRQLCRILADTHAIGVLHGCLGPDSIWIGEQAGKRDAVTLTDFGLSSLLEGAKLDDEMQRPTSPEEVMGIDRGPEQDIYLLGCLAYRLLAGVAPFSSGTAEQLRRRHAIEDVTPLANRVVEVAVPAGLAAVVDRCLAKMPGDRYPDAASLELALCEAQLEAGIRTPWDALPLPADMSPERRQAFEAFVAAPEVRAAAPVATPPPASPEPPEAAGSADSEAVTASAAVLEAPRAARPGRARWLALAGAAAIVIAVVAGLALGNREGEPQVAARPGKGVEADAAPVAPKPPSPAPDPVARVAPDPAPAVIEPLPEPEEPEQPDPEPPEPEPEPEPASGPRHGPGNTAEDAAEATLSPAELARKAEQHFNRSDYRGAARYLKRAISGAPSKPEYRLSLGDAYFKLGRYPEARKSYEKAKSLGSPLADRRLAKVAAKLGG